MDTSIPIRVFVCEDQPVVVEALVRILGECADLTLAGVAGNLLGTVTNLTSDVDVLLLGQPPSARSVLSMLAGLSDLVRSVPTVVWVSELGEVDTFRALRMGARGILRRTDTVAALLSCLRAVGSGETWLGNSRSAGSMPRSASARITPRERQVIEYLCQGLSNQQIAERLGIAPGTVKVHLMHIFEKTGVRDRFALAEHGRRFLSTEGGQAFPGL